MINLIRKIINETENEVFTITSWFYAFIGILFIRFLLESISTVVQPGILPFGMSGLIHIGLFFLTIILGTAVIVGFFTKEYKNLLKTIVFVLPVIWIAPIIDIVLSKGGGFLMTYIRDTNSKIIWNFLTFFGTDFTNGATIGIRVEILIIMVGVALYVYIKKSSFLKSFLAALFTYIFGFTIASLPGIIYTLTHINSAPVQPIEVLKYIASLIFNSNISHNTLGLISNSNFTANSFELGFDRFMSQILFLLSLIFTAYLLSKIDKNKFLVVIKNIRPERLNFYTASIICGAGYAFINNLSGNFVWTDLLGLSCLLVAWVGLWMQAVHVNDIEDISIDKISNKERPLVREEIDLNQMKDVGNLWLMIGLFGSWLAGFYPFFMSLVYIAASYIYSKPPLRLRRYPVIPSFLISVACLATILAGFFFVSINKDLKIFPPILATGILITVTLAINFKDLKDIEGDKENGILTIPIIFGENGFKAVGIFIALSILLVPFFLSFYFLYIFAIPLSILSYKAIVKKPYNEKWVFYIRFIFLVCIAASYLFIYFVK
jgi:4-hydroxybenzoate polyprenyltransferase